MSISREDWGRLILRVAIGGLLLFHGVHKLRTGITGPNSITEMVVAHGLPAQLAYGVYVGEVIAPLLVVCGFLTVPAALVIAVNMAVAIYLAHMKDVAALSPHGGWAIELPMIYLLGALAIAVLGPGDLALRSGRKG